MTTTALEKILKQREIKNEQIVAIARLSVFFLTGVLDWLAYLKAIEFTVIPPTTRTLFLDSVLVVFSLLIILGAFHLPYRPIFKYFTITLDFVFVGLLLTFDPTVPKEGPTVPWIAMAAGLFIFMYNLLRFSKSGTLFSALLSIIFFLSVNYLAKTSFADTLPVLLGFLMMLMVGYTITIANIKMMREANAKQMLERFLPPQLIDELYNNQASIEPGGKTQEVTIVFSDVREFTSLAESMPPNEVVALLNDYLSTMTDVIFSHQGTIDKFVGDAIMTIFGAPIIAKDDTVRAVKTALAMQNAMKSVNARHPELKHRLEIGIGIHAGEVIVGNIGSERRLDYTVIGDNVNLASRIEGLTKFYQCPILISHTVYERIIASELQGEFQIREIDTVRVQGKSSGIRIYEVQV